MAAQTPEGPPDTKTHHHLRKNLKCGICQDVYKLPKLLPCFHSFCLRCLEQLVSVKGSPFRCPSCRKVTVVPDEGPAGFQSNMYLSESELERARENVTLCRLHVNYEEPLTFFCVSCDEAICLRCKLTLHEGHRCEDLVSSDKRGRRLVRAKREVSDMMESLQDGVNFSEDQLRQLDAKKALLVQQVHDRYDSLVAIAGKWKDSVLKDLEKTSEAIRFSVTSERDNLATDLKTCCTQRKRLQQVLDDVAEDQRTVTEAERVLRAPADMEGLKKKLRGELSSSSSPSSILRPGLWCGSLGDGIGGYGGGGGGELALLREEDVRRFIGIPTVFKLPRPGPAMEIISRFHQCQVDKMPRQVLALCVTNDGNVHCMYGDAPFGGGGQWGKRTVSSACQTLKDNTVGQRFIFKKFSGGKKYCITHHEVHGNRVSLNSKSGSLAQLVYQPASSLCSLNEVEIADDPSQRQNQPKVSSRLVQNIHTAGRPLALDVNADSSIWAVLEEIPEGAEKKGQVHAGPSRRVVRLYGRGQKECVTTYHPPDPKSFTPSDVCFWRHDGKEKLLVGDYSNDLVHVIAVHVINALKVRCVVERYLAAGCGDLVQPTAFDTDCQGRLWIGCSNGWILRCQALPGASDNVKSADGDHTAKERNREGSNDQ